MGPRRRSRGKRACVSFQPSTIERFNGATTKESWKTCIASMGCQNPRSASMGPRRRSRGKHWQTRPLATAEVELQWGHDEGVVENSRCVQGTTLRSMLQWGHDEGVVENQTKYGQIKRANDSFNGATTKESWKTKTCGLIPVCHTVLQWGHDEGVVENDGYCRRRFAMGVASMGPRRRSRGKRRLLRRRFAMACCFNGATTKESWKTDSNDPEPRRRDDASMGPRRRSRGKRRAYDWDGDRATASMGPRRRSRGRLLAMACVFLETTASMGPRRRSRGRLIG